MLSVYFIEDDELTALHVMAALSRASDLACLGRSTSLAAALRELPRLRPQVVVTDISLPDGEGTELIAALRDGRCSAPAWWPHVLAYSVHEDEHRVLRAIESGADDYMPKNGRPEELIEAVRRIGRGEASISPAIARHVHARLREDRGALALDPADDELLRLVAQGYLIEEVAHRLRMSTQAVSRRVRRLYARLYCSTRSGSNEVAAVSPAGVPRAGLMPSFALR